MQWNESVDYNLSSAIPKYLGALICRTPKLSLIVYNIQSGKSVFSSQLFLTTIFWTLFHFLNSSGIFNNYWCFVIHVTYSWNINSLIYTLKFNFYTVIAVFSDIYTKSLLFRKITYFKNEINCKLNVIFLDSRAHFMFSIVNIQDIFQFKKQRFVIALINL